MPVVPLTRGKGPGSDGSRVPDPGTLPDVASIVRSLVPVTRTGAALWGWRNRRPIIEWAGFGIRAAQQLLAGERDDILTEARLRAALTRDPATRQAPVTVTVEDGVARLSGTVDQPLADQAFAIAERTPGVRRVRNDLRTRGKRRRLALRS